MSDRCNISKRQARDDYNILSLFFFNYVTQEEPFPSLPLDYELHCPLSYWVFPPRGQKPPQRNNVDVSLTDRELTLIMQWEIHFQKEGSSVWWKTRRLLHMRQNARAMHTKQHARDSAYTDTSTNTDVISGQSLWEIHNVLLQNHKRTLQHVAVWSS